MKRERENKKTKTNQNNKKNIIITNGRWKSTQNKHKRNAKIIKQQNQHTHKKKRKLINDQTKTKRKSKGKTNKQPNNKLFCLQFCKIAFLFCKIIIIYKKYI